ncbi:hypothetical protein [Paenibacillus dendritiformis]
MARKPIDSLRPAFHTSSRLHHCAVINHYRIHLRSKLLLTQVYNHAVTFGQAHFCLLSLAFHFDGEKVRTPAMENRELQMEGSGRSTRHIEIALPAGMEYREGDHLGVLPCNSNENVERILRRFRLHGNDRLIVTANGRNLVHRPLDRPVNLRDLLRYSGFYLP